MSELRPRVGAHYPRSAGEFRSWFGTDADCLDYLDWLRWPDGFVCPEFGNHGGWRVADGRYKCASFGGPHIRDGGGCWAPIRVRSTQPTCRVTLTSSSSGSIGAAPAAEACSSTGSWN